MENTPNLDEDSQKLEPGDLARVAQVARAAKGWHASCTVIGLHQMHAAILNARAQPLAHHALQTPFMKKSRLSSTWRLQHFNSIPCFADFCHDYTRLE